MRAHFALNKGQKDGYSFEFFEAIVIAPRISAPKQADKLEAEVMVHSLGVKVWKNLTVGPCFQKKIDKSRENYGQALCDFCSEALQ